MFSKKYNQAYVDNINAQTDQALRRIEELESEIRQHKDLAAELRIVKQLLNDDDAVLELLECAAELKEELDAIHRRGESNLSGRAISALHDHEEEAAFRRAAQMDAIYGTNQLRSGAVARAAYGANLAQSQQQFSMSFMDLRRLLKH